MLDKRIYLTSAYKSNINPLWIFNRCRFHKVLMMHAVIDAMIEVVIDAMIDLVMVISAYK